MKNKDSNSQARLKTSAIDQPQVGLGQKGKSRVVLWVGFGLSKALLKRNPSHTTSLEQKALRVKDETAHASDLALPASDYSIFCEKLHRHTPASAVDETFLNLGRCN